MKGDYCTRCGSALLNSGACPVIGCIHWPNSKPDDEFGPVNLNGLEPDVIPPDPRNTRIAELEAEVERVKQQWGESDRAWVAARQEAQQLKAERDRLREALKRTPRSCPCQDYWRTDEEAALEVE